MGGWERHRLYCKSKDTDPIITEQGLIRSPLLIIESPHFKCDLFLRFKIGKLLHHDNIICLTGEPGDVLSPNPRPKRKVVGIMSTYEEFMVLLTIGLLIVAILNLKNKK